MLAVIRTGGKQYKVRAGDELLVERFPLDKSKTIKFDQVLLVSKDDAALIGQPLVAGAYCEAELLKEIKGPKVISFKYKRRKKQATKIGHRQQYLKVKIQSIHSK